MIIKEEIEVWLSKALEDGANQELVQTKSWGKPRAGANQEIGHWEMIVAVVVLRFWACHNSLAWTLLGNYSLSFSLSMEWSLVWLLAFMWKIAFGKPISRDVDYRLWDLVGRGLTIAYGCELKGSSGQHKKFFHP